MYSRNSRRMEENKDEGRKEGRHGTKEKGKAGSEEGRIVERRGGRKHLKGISILINSTVYPKLPRLCL
jgi:hypothetical protein